jgi:hypothetical protein
MSTNTPSPSPTEAPQKLVDLHETSKQKSFIDELAKSHGLTEPEKQKFTEKYQKAIGELLKKYEGKKDVVIGEISDILGKFKESLQHEKNDDDDATEFSSQSPDTDKTDTDSEKKLGDKEIDEHIKQLSDKIESKLNAPTTTPETTPSWQAAQQVVEKTLWELNISADIPSIPNDYESKDRPSGLVNMIIKIFDSLGLSFIANYLKMSTMGYKTEKQMEYTKVAMNNLLSVKESPIGSIIRLDDITEREYRKILSNHTDLDFSVKENAEAALLGKHADNPKYKKYHRIYMGIEKKAEELTNVESADYNPVARLESLLDCSKDESIVVPYDTEEDTTTPPPAVENPPIKTDVQKLEEQKQEIKSAQEADANLEQAKKDLDTARALPDSPDKWAKVTEAETKLKEAEVVVKNITEWSKTKVSEMLKKTEDELKDTKLTKEQKINQRKTLETQLSRDPNNTTIKNDVSNVTTEIRNLEIKEKTLEETIGKIKAEQEKFPKDTTKTISATEAQKTAQEAERLALEGNGTVDVQQTKEENESQEQIFQKELQELTEEVRNTLHDKNENFSEIDSPEDILELQKRIDSFLEGKKPEILKKYNTSIADIKSKIEFAQGKVDLIKLWKKKEAEWWALDQKINYWAWTYGGIWDGFVEVDGTDVDVDIAWDKDDNVLIKTTDTTIIPRLWGEVSNVVKIIRENEKKLTGTEWFKSKKGKVFPINFDK